MPEVDEIVPLASERSAGHALTWRGRDWTIATPTPDAFRDCALALFSAGAALSREWAPPAVEGGAIVIDNSSAWRMDPAVPLVVPEVNGERVRERGKGIVANPNCATIQLVVALDALRRTASLRRVVVSTYQSVSGAGQKGLAAYREELAGGAAAASPFPSRIVGNVVPRIGPAQPTGWTEEEEKMRAETRKILALPTLPLAATCVRVPVEVGHAVSAMVELDRPVDRDAAAAALQSAGLRVGTGTEDPLPLNVAGSDDVHVGRLRSDRDHPNVLHMWIVADNLRKGAATNAVQIAQSVYRG